MRGGAAVQSLTGARNGRSDCRHPECRPLDRLFLAVKGDKRIFSFSWRATGGQTDFLFQEGQTDLFIFTTGHPQRTGGGIEHVALDKACCALTAVLMQ